MYFWRIGKLKNALLTGGVSELAAFGYLMLYVFFEQLNYVVPDSDKSLWSILTDVVGGFLMLLTVMYAFWKNGGTDGRDFLKRFFAVGWVVSIRVFVLFALPVMVVFYATLAAIGSSFEQTTWYEFLMLTSFEIAILWRIGHHLGDLAAMEKNEAEAAVVAPETAV